jgi:hypothetical protein
LRLWAVACVWLRHGEILFRAYDGYFRVMRRRVEALVDVGPEEADRLGHALLHAMRDWERDRSPRSEYRDLIEFVANLLTFGASHGGFLQRLVDTALPWLEPQRLGRPGMEYPWFLPRRTVNRVGRPEPDDGVFSSHDQRVSAANARLLRCVLGNAWRQPIIDPAWLRWNGGVIPTLAQSIYAADSFGELPVLADALQESGCTDDYLLGHLRSGLHCRGCHAIDAILGRHPPLPAPQFDGARARVSNTPTGSLRPAGAG